MKLMVVLSRFPYPLEKGDKLRAFYQIKELAKYNSVVLCCFTHGWVSSKQLKELRPYCSDIKVIKLNWWKTILNMLKTFRNNEPFQVAYFYQDQAQKEFDQYVGEQLPKHIFCQMVRTAKYLEKYSIFPKTLDYMDVLSKGAERRVEKAPSYLKPLLKKESERLKLFESKVFDWFTVKTIISEQDRELINHQNKNEIQIIRNGVNTTYFSPVLDKEKKYDIVFTGNMNYPPNVDGAVYLVREILPIVRKEVNGVKLLIAGANPSKKVKELQSKSIHVSGWMDDIREAYSSSKVFVAPMRIGTGLQNKLLEAMSMKIPCVTTELANNALQAKANENILIGNTAQEIADRLIELIKNEEQRSKIAEGGYNFVLQNYNWEIFCDQLDRLIKEASEHPIER